MKHLFLLLFLSLGLFGQAQTLPPNVLEEKNSDSYTNYHFLVEGLSHHPDSIRHTANSLLVQYCSAKPCHTVYFWRSEKAYNLFNYNQEVLTMAQFNEDKKRLRKAVNTWKKENWVYVSESLAGIYAGPPTSKLEIEPYLDGVYRHYGGKLNRPEPASVKMKIKAPAETDTKPKPEPESPVSPVLYGVLGVSIALLIAYFVRRKNHSV
ncbi:hypothetical protein [Spirosoma sp. KUDC1026]|uniref:hypothetical protein n=1 Tax=Spirosoma sp. KUDC1026 TaxID=2745947 RepID=UPI00159BB07D|nr:hypothetical protein [Spirosoma sp. KUDC1026]QKZ12921.1 hypothetical protein HU175_09870 [Spirosoma sp. KUDC1026]